MCRRSSTYLQRVVVLLQEAVHVVGHAPGEVLEDELVALQARFLVVGVRVAPVVLLRGGCQERDGSGRRRASVALSTLGAKLCFVAGLELHVCSFTGYATAEKRKRIVHLPICSQGATPASSESIVLSSRSIVSYSFFSQTRRGCTVGGRLKRRANALQATYCLYLVAC